MPKAIARLADLLEHLAMHGPTGFSAVQQALGLNRPALSRLLTDAVACGLVGHEATGAYRIGTRLARLLPPPDDPLTRFSAAAPPWLEHLRRRCANSAMAVAWTGNHMVCLAVAVHEDAIPLQAVGHIADNLAHTPWGWCFDPARALTLARQHRQRALASSGQPAAAGPATIRDELARLADHGWCAHLQPGKRRLAAPVHGSDGRIVGALALGGHAGSLPDERIEACGQELRAAARSLSRLLA